MHTPLLPVRTFVGRVTAAAAAVAIAPVQRGSLRNAQAAIAAHRGVPEGGIGGAVRPMDRTPPGT